MHTHQQRVSTELPPDPLKADFLLKQNPDRVPCFFFLHVEFEFPAVAPSRQLARFTRLTFFYVVQMRLMEAQLVYKSQSGAKTGLQVCCLFTPCWNWSPVPNRPSLT